MPKYSPETIRRINNSKLSPESTFQVRKISPNLDNEPQVLPSNPIKNKTPKPALIAGSPQNTSPSPVVISQPSADDAFQAKMNLKRQSILADKTYLGPSIHRPSNVPVDSQIISCMWSYSDADQSFEAVMARRRADVLKCIV